MRFSCIFKNMGPKYDPISTACAYFGGRFSSNTHAFFSCRRISAIGILGGVVLAGGCVSAPVEPLHADMPQAFVGAKPARTGAAIKRDWWLAFSDANLNELERLGAGGNQDLRQAEAQVKEAQASVDLAGSALFPSISGGGGEARGDKYGFGTVTTKTYGTVSGSWLLDIFGRARAQKKASEAQFLAALAKRDEVRLDVLAEIASTYVNVRYNQQLIVLARQTIENRRRNLELLHEGQRAGETADLQVVQAERLVAKADSELPSLEVQLDSSIDELASLTGEPVAQLRAELMEPAGQPRAKYRIGVGIPADVVRNRPDVRRAEYAFAAAAEEVGVAEAAFYPSLQLSGYLTPTAVSQSGHVNVWTIAADLSAPIFDGGKNKANLAVANARLDEARSAWQAAVLKGISEVEQALAAYNRDGRNVAAQDRFVSTSQEVLRMGKSGFELGADTFFSILDAEKELFDAQKLRSQALRDQALHYIALCKAAPAVTETTAP